MDVMEIDRDPLDPQFTRNAALFIATKTRDENDEKKILRVSTILHHLSSRQYVSSAQWEFLPNELVRYLVDNSVEAKKERSDYTYNSWNMFGLPVGWQIIKCRRMYTMTIFSILVDANSREKDISHCDIHNHKSSITAVTIRHLNRAKITARLDDMNVIGSLTMTVISFVWNYTCMGDSIKKRARKRITDHKYREYSTYKSLHDFYFDSFPELEDEYQLLQGCSESEANIDFNEVRKYFELFQQLLRG